MFSSYINFFHRFRYQSIKKHPKISKEQKIQWNLTRPEFNLDEGKTNSQGAYLQYVTDLLNKNKNKTKSNLMC